MSDRELYALILAGGAGTRLWPRSRSRLPKQMLDLFGDRTMLQQTVERIREIIPPDRVWVMTNAEYIDVVREQLPELPATHVVGEPAPRGTAPAIGLGAQYVAQMNPEGVMFALHADHFIADEAGFRRAMLAAGRVAEEDFLVNLAVDPDRPETSYGYVELGASLGTFEGQEAYHVLRFREKPDQETARQYVASGRFRWNSGIFCWRVDTIQREFERLLPDIQERLVEIGRHVGAPDEREVLAEQWARLEGDVTIDEGIMERAEQVATVPVDVGWSDVGSWDSLAALTPKDQHGNSITGPCEAIALETRNAFVYSEQKLVALVGVEDLIVVDTPDALLVLPRSRAQDVKQIVNQLKRDQRDDLL